MSQGILDEHDLQAQFSRKAVQAAKAFLKEPGFSQIAIGEQAVLARFNDSDWVSIQSPSRRLISYCSCESEDNVHGIAAALYQGGLQAARPPRFIQASNTEQLEYPIEVPAIDTLDIHWILEQDPSQGKVSIYARSPDGQILNRALWDLYSHKDILGLFPKEARPLLSHYLTGDDWDFFKPTTLYSVDEHSDDWIRLLGSGVLKTVDGYPLAWQHDPVQVQCYCQWDSGYWVKTLRLAAKIGPQLSRNQVLMIPSTVPVALSEDGQLMQIQSSAAAVQRFLNHPPSVNIDIKQAQQLASTTVQETMKADGVSMRIDPLLKQVEICDIPVRPALRMRRVGEDLLIRLGFGYKEQVIWGRQSGQYILDPVHMEMIPRDLNLEDAVLEFFKIYSTHDRSPYYWISAANLTRLVNDCSAESITQEWAEALDAYLSVSDTPVTANCEIRAIDGPLAIEYQLDLACQGEPLSRDRYLMGKSYGYWKDESGALHRVKIHPILKDLIREADASLSGCMSLGQCQALDEEGVLQFAAELKPSWDEMKVPIAVDDNLLKDAQLFPYQAAGVSWILNRQAHGFHPILADDMGLGKTVQSIAVLSAMARQKPWTDPVLIVAPKSVIRQWEHDIQKFFPELSTWVYDGPKRQWPEMKGVKLPVMITHYALIRQDLPHFNSTQFSLVIADELQWLKNPESKISMAMKELKSQYRLGLTGTPLENHVGDLWSVFSYLDPKVLGSQAAFERQIRRPLQYGHDGALDTLRQRIAPFVLRRTKASVGLQLPEKTEQTIWIEMSEEERRGYQQLCEENRDRWQRSVGQGIPDSQQRFHILAILNRLRQWAAFPRLVDPQYSGSMSKMNWMMEQLQRLASTGHKVVVFSQYLGIIRYLSEQLEHQGFKHEILTGATVDRDQVLRRFQTQDDIPVLIMSLKAGGTGITVTAAYYLFLFEPWWNPAIEDQAIHRIYRIGQERPVFIYRCIMSHSIESKIYDLSRQKQDIFDAVMNLDELSGLS